MVECLTPKISPNSVQEIMPRKLLTASRSTSVNLDFEFLSPRAHFTRPAFQECTLFSLYVTYSRLVRSLFERLKSLWFTQRGLGPTKASITKRWTLKVFCLFFVEKLIRGYPNRLRLRRMIRSLPHLSERTLPLSLIRYIPSYPGTSRHISMILLTLSLTGCASIAIPDLHPEITLPGSLDCYSKSTLSRETYRIPASRCAERSKLAIKLYSNDWQILRVALLKNCLTNQCKQSVGALDELFEVLDKSAAAVLKLKGKGK